MSPKILFRPLSLALLLSFGTSQVQAQLPGVGPVGPILDRAGGIGGQVEQVTRQVDTAAERAGREIGREIERTAERAFEEAAKAAESGLEALETQGLDNPLGPLPELLDIVDISGRTSLREVEVENQWRAIQQQWLVMVETGERALLDIPAIEVLEESNYPDLGLSLVRFEVESAFDSRDGLLQLLPPELVERLDRNHVYAPQSQLTETAEVPDRWTSICQAPVRIGMIDTGIERNHPSFASARIEEKNFISADVPQSPEQQPRNHGTAVAGVMVGKIGDNPPRLPTATLLNAAVFYARDQYVQGTTLSHLVQAINWLVGEEVSVINMSLTGPDNRVLKVALERAIHKNVTIVAAAGNGGPAARPFFPAAYDNVIAATAVDAEANIYRWANRGDYIDFAAAGVAVLTARKDQQWGRESGTSIAAPTVSAYVACEKALNNNNWEDLMAALVKKVDDLGAPGRDPIFGYGLLR